MITSDFQILRTTLKKVRLDGNLVQESVVQAMEQALRGLNNQWDDLKPHGRELLYNKIVYVAREELLHKEFGGRADDGWDRSKFGSVMATCKRSIMYDVPVSIARATHEKLRKARQYVETNLKDAGGMYRDRMIYAFEVLKEEEDRKLEEIKAEGRIKKEGKQPVVGEPIAV